MLKNTMTQYGVVTKVFHWVMALLIISLLCVGFYMNGMSLGLAKFKIYALHKSFGIIVLVLAILRILWHLYSKKPALVSSLKPTEKYAAHTAHILLYVLFVFMPLSGWLMSSAFGRSVKFFGTISLPDLLTKNRELAEILATVHFVIAWSLVVLITLHVVAALKHHIIDKDNTLRRMLILPKDK